MKRYTHGPVTIVVPDEKVGVANLEFGDRTIRVESPSGEAFKLGEFVRECMGHANTVTRHLNEVEATEKQLEAAKHRLGKLKQSITDLKSDDFVSDDHLAYELRMAAGDMDRAVNAVKDAEITNAHKSRGASAYFDELSSEVK